jgi:hypothetical protein
MAKVRGASFHKANDEFDHALASKEDDGNGYKVTIFPEPGSQHDVKHNVQEGTEAGQVSFD